jgi:AbrB family looped-hinge helix DNA binding protein
MGHKVGSKGQVVIEKAIRDKLGIQPGSVAVQRVVDDHVELHFRCPGHKRSLFGAARPFIKRWPTPEELEQEHLGWAEAAAEKERRILKELRARNRRHERAGEVPDGDSATPG